MQSTKLYIRIIIIILIFKNSTQSPRRRWNLDFYNLACFKNSNTFKTFECNFNKLAASHYVFSIRMMFNKNLDKQFFIRYLIDIRPPLKKTVIHFIDVKVRACDLIGTDYDIPIFQSLILEVRKTANLPYQCPFKKEYLYEITNLSVTDKLLIISFPLVNFTNVIEFYESSQIIGSFVTHGGVVAKTKKFK